MSVMRTDVRWLYPYLVVHSNNLDLFYVCVLNRSLSKLFTPPQMEPSHTIYYGNIVAAKGEWVDG